MFNWEAAGLVISALGSAIAIAIALVGVAWLLGPLGSGVVLIGGVAVVLISLTTGTPLRENRYQRCRKMNGRRPVWLRTEGNHLVVLVQEGDGEDWPVWKEIIREERDIGEISHIWDDPQYLPLLKNVEKAEK